MATPDEIFQLIVKADEKLKYATAGKGDVRAQQAADLLAEAMREAEAIGNEGLVQQAKVRLTDLETLLTGGDPAV
jgi:soluble cytochrome b562